MRGARFVPSATTRGRIRRRQRWIHTQVLSPHYESELDAITDAILARKGTPGDVAEFGCYKGGSTAKLSLAAASVGKRLVVFDSFEGLPDPEPWDAEHHIERPRTFLAGEYAGTLDEVRGNIGRFGRLDVCEFFPGWFSETLHRLTGPISVAFADVDLATSTREVVAATWPLLSPGGILFVHDATDEKLQQALIEFGLPSLSKSFLPRRDDLPNLKTKTLAWFEKPG
jgi:O-methyltransferase